MTSKPKVYQNYRFDELIAFAQHNPHRSRSLRPIGVISSIGTGGKGEKENGIERAMGLGIEKERVVEKEKSAWGWKGYTILDVEPSGILSMVVCMEDPHAYALSTPSIRSQQVIDVCTRLQQRTDELKNGPLTRKRKRIYDLLGALYNGSTSLEEKDYADLFMALEVFQEAYFIRLHRVVQDMVEGGGKEEKAGKEFTPRESHTLSFSSSPLLWKRDRPIWLVDANGRWMAIPTDTLRPMSDELGKWLNDVEEKGWKVEWPEVDGTKTDIVEQLTALGVWEEGDKKKTKDVLAVRLAREKILRFFGYRGASSPSRDT